MPAVDQAGADGLSEDLALLLEAGREAGRIAMRYFKRNPEVWLKGGSSPVSEADYAVDAYLRGTLLAARPDYGWLSEETADSPARLSTRRLFVVDPIDGTRGFLEGGSRWCVSMAVVEAGRSIAGVLECPVNQETFSAVAGGGAFNNGKRLTLREPDDTIVIAGPREMVDRSPAAMLRRMRRHAHIPSLAYRLAMVADGELHATFVKPAAHDWDLAAADLILAEAGGVILDASGRRPAYGAEVTTHGVLVAGSPATVAAIGSAIGIGVG